MDNITCIETLTSPSKVLSMFSLLSVEKIRVSNIIRIILNYLIDYLLCGITILNMRNAIHMKDKASAYWMACLLIPMGTYSAKKTSLLLNRSSLKVLFQYLKSDIFNSSNGKLNRRIRLIHKTSQFMYKYFSGVIFIAIMICGILPFVMDVRLMIPPPFSLGTFDIGYKILQLLCLVYLGVTVVALDIFYMTLIGLGVAQIYILEERLICIKSVKHNSYAMKRILNDCVILYEAIYRYVQNLSIILALPLSTQYLSGCFAVSNMLLQMRYSNEAHNIMGPVISYSALTLGQMAAYHWLSNELIYKSDQITTACYFSKWYELNTSSRKSLILIMERAKRPLTIRLYNYILLNLDSLGAIFRWSYSIFALMKASS